MNTDQAIAILHPHRDELRRRGVRTLGLFGSVARGEARPDSDVDLLVDFEIVVGLFEFPELKELLESWLGRPVDLVPRDGIKRQLRAAILAEVVRAA